jgi:hypothetical protein
VRAQATELGEAVGVRLGIVDQAGDGLFRSTLGGILLSTVQSSLSVSCFHRGGYTVLFLQQSWDATMQLTTARVLTAQGYMCYVSRGRPVIGGRTMTETVVSLVGTDGTSELHEVLKRRLAEIDKEREDLLERRRELDAALNRIDEERGHIVALLGLDGSTVAADVQATTLSDDPADLVVRLLRETGPLHYRDIERQLRSRGWYQAGGADPANTLLAKYFQDPRLYRPRRGVYAIRPEGATVQSVGTRRKGVRRRRRRSVTAA